MSVYNPVCVGPGRKPERLLSHDAAYIIAAHRRLSVYCRENHIITRIDVYETLCPQQMLVHKGGKIKNWGGECRDVSPTKSLSQNIRVDVNREVKFL